MGVYESMVTHERVGRNTKKLIEEVVAVVDDGGPPPQELRLAWLVDQWGSLPEAGGLYDQDAQTLKRMTVLNNIYKVVTRLRSAKGAEIHNLSEADRRIIGELRKIEIL